MASGKNSFHLPSEVSALGKLILVFTLIAIIITPSAVLAQARAVGYSTWDDNYFYAAFKVDDPNVVGTNTKLASNPWEDDCVEIFIETDNAHHKGRSAHTIHMAVSAAGGSAFTVGSEDGTWTKKPIVSFKYQASIEGTINNPDDLDAGYTVELAIPWFEMGIKPPTPGTIMSFNAVIRMHGDKTAFASLSPNVQSESDIHDASKWSDIVFTGPVFGAATLSRERIVSAKYVARTPLIDGQIAPSEWNKNTSFTIPLPIEMPKLPKHQLQKTVATYYFYWYQGDPRKSAPFAHVREADGESALTDHPIKSPGMWFSYDRVEWHKEELSDMKKAGIDVVLPVYWGDGVNSAGFARKGLDCMVEALRELKREGRPYPMVGMFFDTTAMFSAYGSKPDLRDEEVKRTFYGMIKEFFQRVPEEFRAQVEMGDERAGRPCVVIDLYTPSWFSGFDESFVKYVNESFAKDFNANILWFGDEAYAQFKCLDGYASYGAGLGAKFNDTGIVKIATVGAGYDDSAVPGRNTPIRSRQGTNTYKSDWASMLPNNPHWVIVDGWNEFHEGSELCASRQYGRAFIEETKMQVLRFRGPKEYDTRFIRRNVPDVIPADRICQAEFVIGNVGNRVWLASEGYALTYRWYQDGRLIADSAVRMRIDKDVQPGQMVDVTLGIAPATPSGKPLPDGSYELRFEMIRLADNKPLSALGDRWLSVPVRVGAVDAAKKAAWLEVDGPVMVRTGAAYTYKVRVRNDGSAVWKAGSTALSYRLFKESNYIHGWSDERSEEIEVALVKAQLPKDVRPGEVVDIPVNVVLKDKNGKAIATWKQSDAWSYHLKFDLIEGTKWFSDVGSPVCDRVIDIFENDFGARIVAADLPVNLDAGRTYDVKLVVRNTSPDNWDGKKGYGFGCHWYYLDGTEAAWNTEITPIKTPIAAGQPSVVSVKVSAPKYDGRYIAVFDLNVRGVWASTGDITRGSDIFVQEVNVTGGKLTFLDLTKVFDIASSSPDTDYASGDFDGAGHSFPAEMMPPHFGMMEPYSDVYPSGYLGRAAAGEQQAMKRISFRYGSKSAGEKNAVKCVGQELTVPAGEYVNVHVLAAAVDTEQEAVFTLQFASGQRESKITVSGWNAQGENTAFTALHRHSAAGDERGIKCRIYHYVLPVDKSAGRLTGIRLPNNDKVRVFAVTLEAA